MAQDLPLATEGRHRIPIPHRFGVGGNVLINLPALPIQTGIDFSYTGYERAKLDLEIDVGGFFEDFGVTLSLFYCDYSINKLFSCSSMTSSL